MIHLLFTGGTISMQRDERAGGNVPVLSGDALVQLAPGLREVGPFTVEDWGRYPACHMGPDTLWRLRERVRQLSESGPHQGERLDGLVITHGTDTIEETAYLLGRTLGHETPVVLTGAMRTSSDSAWDGAQNLVDAARVAGDPESRGRGALVVLFGKIFVGTEVVKVDTTALESFAAPHAAPIGRVQGGTVTYAVGPKPESPVEPPGLTARVAMVPMVIGDQGELLECARPMHDGVVVVAFGSGNIPPGAVPAIHRWLAEGKPVVLASRCLRGQVTGAYAFDGGGGTLLRAGVIPAGPRTPSQARMELMIALSAGLRYGG